MSMTEVDPKTPSPEFAFNQYAPGGVWKQLSDAAGGQTIIYDQRVTGGSEEQIRRLVDSTLVYNQYASGGCMWQLYQHISSGSPPGTSGSIDFSTGEVIPPVGGL